MGNQDLMSSLFVGDVIEIEEEYEKNIKTVPLLTRLVNRFTIVVLLIYERKIWKK